MEVQKALLNNLFAGGWAKVSTVIFRLVQVPILLSFLGIEDYGRWLVLYALPSWLSLANLGFGSVASNDISMAVGKGDIARARTVLSSTLRLVNYLFAGGALVLIPLAIFVHW